LKFDLFNENAGVAKEKWHPKVQLLNDDRLFYPERKIIQGWTEGLIDRDNKMIKEFQTTFHSCFWEFYLYALFCKLGFTLDQTHNRPDFIINGPYPLYVEAVVANISKSGTNESQRNMNDILSMMSPPWVQGDFYALSQDSPEYIDEGVFLFHNPNAKYKITPEMFGNTNITQIFFDNGRILRNADTYPIVARLNFIKGLERLLHPYIEQQMMLYNREDMNKVLKHFKDNFFLKCFPDIYANARHLFLNISKVNRDVTISMEKRAFCT
jgi:hypothetical protein